MADLGQTFNSIFSGSQSVVWTFVLLVVLVVVAIGLLTAFASWWYFKKRWNLRIEIKLVRSDGKLTLGEWGKGMFNAKKGVVFIKRQGSKFAAIPIKVFDIKRYLQGEDLLTVIQVGPEDYRPVLNESWSSHNVEYVNEETGEVKVIKEAVIDIEVDTGMNKAWKSSWDNAAKRAFSLQSVFTQFQTPIAIGIVIISCFVGFAMIWTRLGTVCG